MAPSKVVPLSFLRLPNVAGSRRQSVATCVPAGRPSIASQTTQWRDARGMRLVVLLQHRRPRAEPTTNACLCSPSAPTTALNGGCERPLFEPSCLGHSGDVCGGVELWVTARRCSGRNNAANGGARRRVIAPHRRVQTGHRAGRTQLIVPLRALRNGRGQPSRVTFRPAEQSGRGTLTHCCGSAQ